MLQPLLRRAPPRRLRPELLPELSELLPDLPGGMLPAGRHLGAAGRLDGAARTGAADGRRAPSVGTARSGPNLPATAAAVLRAGTHALGMTG